MWETAWEMGCTVGESGVEWGRMVRHVEPGWQGSSHPATRVRNSARRMRTLDFPRNLRIRARREAPADGPREVPRDARRRRRAGRLARGETRLVPLGFDLDAGRLRTVHGADAGRAESVLADGPRAEAVLLQLLV